MIENSFVFNIIPESFNPSSQILHSIVRQPDGNIAMTIKYRKCSRKIVEIFCAMSEYYRIGEEKW